MNKITALTDIVSIRTLEKIQDNFAEATGIGCVMRNIKGEPITKFSRHSRLWMEVIKRPGIEKELEPDLLLALEKCFKTGQIQIIQRYMDSYAFIVPMGIEGRIVSFLVGGLVRYGNPKIVNCAKEADRLGIDLDTFLEMYLELALVTPERLESCANLFKIVAQSISTLAKEGNEAKAKADQMVSINDMLEKEVEMASLELKESEERYRNLFNAISDGVYMTDLEGHIKDINPAGAKMLGYTRGELIGTNMRNLYVNPADRDVFMATVMAKGHLDKFHPIIQIKNGPVSRFESSSAVIKDQFGKISGVQGIFRDISQRNHSSIKTGHSDVSSKTNIPGVKNH